jgi:hypothetical protein
METKLQQISNVVKNIKQRQMTDEDFDKLLFVLNDNKKTAYKRSSNKPEDFYEGAIFNYYCTERQRMFQLIVTYVRSGIVFYKDFIDDVFFDEDSFPMHCLFAEKMLEPQILICDKNPEYYELIPAYPEFTKVQYNFKGYNNGQ